MKWSILRQSPFWQGLDKVESWHGGGVLVVVVDGFVAAAAAGGGGGGGVVVVVWWWWWWCVCNCVMFSKGQSGVSSAFHTPCVDVLLTNEQRCLLFSS